MTHEFVIRPPNKKSDDHVKIPDILPKLPLRMIIYGSSASGKGVLLNNMLGPRFPYRKIFGKNVFIFSSTFSLGDDSLSDIDVSDDNIFESLDEHLLRDIVDEQKSIIHEFGKHAAPNILIVLDDVLTQISRKQGSVLRELFFSGRHYKISVIMLVQSYKGVTKAMRTNSSHSVIFSFDNKKEVESMREEANANPKIFERILEDATEDRFSFLVVNHKQTDKNKRFQKRFSNEYYSLDVVE